MTNLNQKQHKLFYGWWVIGALFLIWAYASGVILSGFTAFFEPIANEFGWSYAQVSFAASIRDIEIGLFSPLVGLLLDRWGPRRLIFAGAIIIGLSLLLLSRITSLAMFYGVFVLVGVGISPCIGVLPMTVAGNWFRRRVSIVTGIVVSGAAIGGFLVLLITRLVDIFEWQVAMVILGLGAWVILLPLSLIVRHKPEQYGYLPDGDVNGKLVSSEVMTSSQSEEVDIGSRQALKSSAFWHISLGITCNMLVVIAVTTHVMPYLSSIGIARSSSSLVASVLPITSILGRLSFGWLGDRFDKKWVTAIGCALVSLSILLFIYVATVGTWLLVPFIILFGIGWGGIIPMQVALLREYFGSVRLGSILGFSLAITVLGMVGAPLAGWVFDSFGSYHGVWFAFAGVAIMGMVGLLTTPSGGNTMRVANKIRD
jgi:MFS family permease